MSLTIENFRLLTNKLVERLSPLGTVNIEYEQITSIENGRMVSGMNVTIRVNDKYDKYFITDEGYGPYFTRYWNGV